MIQKIKKFLGLGPGVDLGELIANGAIIIDVRSKGEFAGGHLNNAINIPLDQLSGNLKRIKSKEQVIITCCASGMRSASAKGFLREQGYSQTHNGGSWLSLKKYDK